MIIIVIYVCKVVMCIGTVVMHVHSVYACAYMYYMYGCVYGHMYTSLCVCV